MNATRKCSIDGCDKPAQTRGWCSMHYTRWRRTGETGDPQSKYAATPEERFWPKVDTTGGDESCWLWQGGLGNHGYGIFYPGNGVQVLAHRFSLSLVAPTPLAADALHSCDNKVCVNPRHLKWGTHSQNMFEAALRGRAKAGRKLGAECPSGHTYTPENILTSVRNGRHGKVYTVRSCRECNRIYHANKRAKQKESNNV